jgi:hypothetical protein
MTIARSTEFLTVKDALPEKHPEPNLALLLDSKRRNLQKAAAFMLQASQRLQAASAKEATYFAVLIETSKR